MHRLADEADHLLFVGLHQRDPGGRGSGVGIVLGTPVGHFYQDRDEIQPFFSQGIHLFSLVGRRGLFHQNAGLLQTSQAAGQNIGCHPFF